MGAAWQPESLRLLRCPATGAELGFEGRSDTLGLLVGGNGPYPVLLGVPRIVDDALRAPLVALIRAGRQAEAERLAMQWPSRRLASRVRRRATLELARLVGGSARLAAPVARLSEGDRLLRDAPSLAALVRANTDPLIAEWLMHRFCARTFLPLVALSQALGPADRVLEVGSGIGHSSFVLSRRVPAGNILGLDNVFAHLVLARRWNTPGAVFVCADVEAPLPLVAGCFDAVVMSDTFHFVRAQERLAAETARVLSADGQVILSRIHNAELPDDYPGQARRVEEYEALFAAFAPRLIRNDRLLDALLGTGCVALDDPALVQDVRAAASLSLIGRRGRAGAPVVAQPWRGVAQHRTRLVVNPLLDRSGAQPLHPHLVDILAMPDTEGAPPPPWDTEGTDAGVTADLLRRLVLLDVPARFI